MAARHPSAAVGGGPKIYVYFHGNNEPSSVNAGRPKKVFIGSYSLEEKQKAQQFAQQLKSLGYDVKLGKLEI